MNNEHSTLQIIETSLNKRYRAERRFIWYGRLAIVVGVLALVGLFTSIIGTGYKAFIKTELLLTIDQSVIEASGWNRNVNDNSVDKSGDDIDLKEKIDQINFDGMFKKAVYSSNPTVKKRSQKKRLRQLFSSAVPFELEDYFNKYPEKLNEPVVSIWLTADDKIDSYVKNGYELEGSNLKSSVVDLVEQYRQSEQVRTKFNTTFFTSGDSRDPEQAGIWGAMAGSLLTLLVTLLLSFPIGVSAAIYLEEYAVKNRITSIIEVNINNLAAVPSIIVGLLGLAVFINFFGLPRSTPLVGGLVLTLMTLPTIIIASRAALQSIPPSIKEAALGVGASHTQMVFHHLFPIALPGMLTGSIIGMARALGETAPLLMIGMVAFIVDIPANLTDTATALPVQIYLWADSPERAFVEKTSAAIMVLLTFLITMNSVAVILRKKLERRW